jgi:hypothetical protein
MTDVARAEQPILVALAPALPDDAAVPVRLHRMPEGIVAAYNPAVETRATVWRFLTELFGDLIDVTPASVRGAVA